MQTTLRVVPNMNRSTARASFLILASLLTLGIALSSAPMASGDRELALDLSGRLPQIFRFDFATSAPGSPSPPKPTAEPAQLSRLEAPESFELFGAGEHRLLEQPLPVTMPFRGAIEASASRHQLDSRLLAAVVEAESNFDPRAVSPRGAVGLTQILPRTGGREGAALSDPEVNLDAGALYLRTLLDQYEGDTELALAAYNAGPGRVSRYGGIPPFAETQRYIAKVLELYEQHRQGDWRSNESAPETR